MGLVSRLGMEKICFASALVGVNVWRRKNMDMIPRDDLLAEVL